MKGSKSINQALVTVESSGNGKKESESKWGIRGGEVGRNGLMEVGEKDWVVG